MAIHDIFPADIYLPGDGRRLILFHGFLSVPQNMKAFGRRLNKAGYDVFIPLLPGHNKGRESAEKLTTQDYLNFIEQLLQFEENDQGLILAGFSLGALLALHAATLISPAATLLYSPPLTHGDKDISMIRRAFIREISIMADAEAIWSDRAFEPVAALAPRIRAELPRVNGPVLAFQGANDTLAPPENLNILENHLPPQALSKKILETSGHVLLLSKEKERMIDETLTYLKNISLDPKE